MAKDTWIGGDRLVLICVLAIEGNSIACISDPLPEKFIGEFVSNAKTHAATGEAVDFHGFVSGEVELAQGGIRSPCSDFMRLILEKNVTVFFDVLKNRRDVAHSEDGGVAPEKS